MRFVTGLPGSGWARLARWLDARAVPPGRPLPAPADATADHVLGIAYRHPLDTVVGLSRRRGPAADELLTAWAASARGALALAEGWPGRCVLLNADAALTWPATARAAFGLEAARGHRLAPLPPLLASPVLGRLHDALTPWLPEPLDLYERLEQRAALPAPALQAAWQRVVPELRALLRALPPAGLEPLLAWLLPRLYAPLGGGPRTGPRTGEGAQVLALALRSAARVAECAALQRGLRASEDRQGRLEAALEQAVHEQNRALDRERDTRQAWERWSEQATRELAQAATEIVRLRSGWAEATTRVDDAPRGRRLIEAASRAIKAPLKRALPESTRVALRRVARSGGRGLPLPFDRLRAAGAIEWTWRASFDPPQVLTPSVVRVSGWALHREAAVARVELFVDGSPAGRARLGHPRPDIALAFGLPAAEVCGFQAELDLGARAGHAVEVNARVTTLGGATLGLDGCRVGLPAVAAPDPLAGERPAARRPQCPRPADRPLRVAAFTHGLGLGGGQLYLAALLGRLVEDGAAEVSLLSPGDGPVRSLLRPEIAVDVVDGFPVHDLAAHEARVAQLTAWAAGCQPDVVVVNSLGAFAGAEAASRLGLPVVWAIHESFPIEVFWAVAYPFQMDAAVRARGTRVVRETERAVFAARATADLFRELIPPERHRVLPYGLDLAALGSAPRDAARQALGLPADATVLLCPGTVEPRKCQTLVVQAFARLAARHPDALLVVLGDQSNWYSEGLHRYLRAAGLGDRVRCVPLASEVAPWFAAADGVVLASDIESLPFVVLEAMAAARCVAATAVFGVRERVRDGENGLLFEAGDLGALVGALERLLSMSPAERQRIGATAARDAARDHDLAAYARRFRAVLDEVVPSAPASLPVRASAAPPPARSVRPDRTEPRRIGFVHVPRCGGTFVDAYLADRVLWPRGYAVCNSWGFGLGRDWLPDELLALTRGAPAHAYVHNHAHAWPPRVVRRLRREGWWLFAFVRRPADQWCSFFHWVRGAARPGMWPEVGEWLRGATLDAFLRELLVGRRFTHVREQLRLPEFHDELARVEVFDEGAFDRLLAETFGHVREQVATPRNASSNPGFDAHVAAGDISSETRAMVAEAPETRLFERIAARR
jgi:glycosyltransferase involved in cell wall biosynthesis